MSFKLSDAADLDYYMEGQNETLGLISDESFDTLAELAGMTDEEITARANTNYYDAKLNDDPLARPGVWFGKLAEDLGLQGGSLVQARHFARLYFGYHPDGSGKLHKDIPDIKDQVAYKKERRALTNQHRTTEAAVGRVFKEQYKIALGNGATEEEAKKQAKQSEAFNQACKRRDEANAKLEEFKRQKQPGKRRNATDFGFGAPKPVSIAVMLAMAEGRAKDASEIEDANMDAIRRTMKIVEEQFIKSRPRNGNGNRSIESADTAAAFYTHFDARPVGGGLPDPHLHVHVVTSQLCRGANGEYQALWADYLNANAEWVDSMYQSILAQNLAEKSYTIIPVLTKQGRQTFTLASITRDHIEAFSPRSGQVEENLAAGMSQEDARKVGRGQKSNDSVAFIKSIKTRCDALGIKSTDFKQSAEQFFRAKAEEKLRIRIAEGLVKPPAEKYYQEWHDKQMASIANEAGAGEFGERRKEMSPEAIIEKLTELDPRFTTLELQKFLWERAMVLPLERKPGEEPGDAAQRYVDTMTKQVLESKELVVVDNFKTKLNISESAFTSAKQRAAENEFYGAILPKITQPSRAWNIPEAAAEKQIELAESKQTWKFSMKQVEAIKFLTANSSQLVCLAAWAGAGKTALANIAVKTFEEQGKKVVAIAPSNKAAKGLMEEIGAQNFHTPESLAIAMAGEGTANHKGEIQPPVIDKNTVLYVDEASMLDFRETSPMLKAALERGAKVIFCGDPAQLPAVGLGNVMRNIIYDEKNKSCTLFLTDRFESAESIQRQAKYWQKQATALLSLGDTVRAIDEYDKRGYVQKFALGDELRSRVVADFLSNSKGGSSKALSEARSAYEKSGSANDLLRYQEAVAAVSKDYYGNNLMLATTNDLVGKLNDAARTGLIEAGLLGEKEHAISNGDKKLNLRVGERLVFNEKLKKNSGKTSRTLEKDEKVIATKSTVGTLLGFGKAKDGQRTLIMQIDAPAGSDKQPETVEVDPRLFLDFSYAYALTTHKAQGVSVANTYFAATPDDAQKGVFMSSELALVGMTRHKQKMTVYALDSHYEAFKREAQKITEKKEALDFFQAYSGKDLSPNDGEEEARKERMIAKAIALAEQQEKQNAQPKEEDANEQRTTNTSSTYTPRYQPRYQNPRSQGAAWQDTGERDGLLDMPSGLLDNDATGASTMLLYGDEADHIRHAEGAAGRTALLGESGEREAARLHGGRQPELDKLDAAATAAAKTKADMDLAAAYKGGKPKAAKPITRLDFLIAGERATEIIDRISKAATPKKPQADFERSAKAISAAVKEKFGAQHAEKIDAILALGIAEISPLAGLWSGRAKQMQWIAQDDKYSFGIDSKTGQIEAIRTSKLRGEAKAIASANADRFAGKLAYETKIETVAAVAADNNKTVKGRFVRIESIEPTEANGDKIKAAVIQLENGSEVRLKFVDLIKRIEEEGLQKGDDFTYEDLGKKTVKINVRGEQMEWEKTFFEVKRLPLAPHAIRYAEREAVLAKTLDILKSNPDIDAAVGHEKGNFASAFEYFSKFEASDVHTLRERVSEHIKAGYALGRHTDENGLYTLNLVVIGEANGKIICATPGETAEIAGQTKGANVRGIFAVEPQELEGLSVKPGEAIKLEVSDDEQFAWSRIAPAAEASATARPLEKLLAEKAQRDAAKIKRDAERIIAQNTLTPQEWREKHDQNSLAQSEFDEKQALAKATILPSTIDGMKEEQVAETVKVAVSARDANAISRYLDEGANPAYVANAVADANPGRHPSQLPAEHQAMLAKVATSLEQRSEQNARYAAASANPAPEIPKKQQEQGRQL